MSDKRLPIPRTERLMRLARAWASSSQPARRIEPGPGQESVWDYPRPPAVEQLDAHVQVFAGEVCIADTTRAMRVLETASPPTFYLPPGQIDWSLLEHIEGSSYCEWKGLARYWSLKGDPSRPVAWSYPKPRTSFTRIANFLSFYPGRVACTVDGQQVRAQPGGFYGGWITDEITGPFKGEPGTGHW